MTDLVERLLKREHYFLNAVEGEYDATLLRKARFEIEALSERIAALREAGNTLAETVKLIKSALVAALSKRELEILMADLHAWNVASLTPDLSQ